MTLVKPAAADLHRCSGVSNWSTERPATSASRLRMLDADLWSRLQTLDATTQRQLTATLLRLAMDTAPVTTGREQVEAALATDAFGDSDLRRWLKDTSNAAEVASHEAAELDDDETEAKRQWQLARGTPLPT